MNDNHWRSQTDDWARAKTAAMPRIDNDAATMARPATPAFAWSEEPSGEPAAPEYTATRTKRVPRVMTFAGIGVGAAAAIATALIVVSGPQTQSSQVAAPNAATQSVVSAPTMPASAPTTSAVMPTRTIAPQARSYQNGGNSNSCTHDCTQPQSTDSTPYDGSNGQQNGYQWQPRHDFTPRDFRWFLPHVDGSNDYSYDHDSSRGHESFGGHHSDSSHDDNH